VRTRGTEWEGEEGEKRGRYERKKRNGREGRREERDISGEKGEEIGGTGWEGGWGEGCARRYRGIDAPVRCHSKYIQQFFFGQN
jgi:hypothetical protein